MTIRGSLKGMLLRAGLADPAETIGRCGIELSEPAAGQKGVFLLYGTRLQEYDRVWRYLRRRYVIVLTHHWALQDHILKGYRQRSRRFDCVVSPNEETDKVLDFVPIFRSNSVDLLVDDQLWPRRNLKRDVDVVDSVSVPWILKKGTRWLDEVQRYLDRRGAGKAVYVLKRGPGAKEDEACHTQFREFRSRLDADPRIELRLGVDQKEMMEIYNRARAIYHPSDSEFGCRSILEAMYCGAWAIVDLHDWVKAASANTTILKLVQVQQGLESIPGGELPEIRQWQTAHGLRSQLMEFLSRDHRVNTRIKAFTLFSHVHIDSASRKKTVG